jgi:hypothetical protein
MLKLVGTLVFVVVVLGAATIAVAYWQLTASIGADIARLAASARSSARVVTAQRIAELPPPARRYFAHAGVVGTAIPRLVHLRQTGRIRAGAADRWMELEAEETYSVDPPAFVWSAAFPSRSLPLAIGRDEYLEGKGSILVKMAALVPLADERGEALRAAGLMRFLNEMMWFPAAYLGDNVTITPIDDESFGVAITDRGLAAGATIFVDAAGRITNFRASRYNTATGTMETWETPLRGDGPLAGLTLPIAGSAVWKLEAGDLDYIELAISDLRYED